MRKMMILVVMISLMVSILPVSGATVPVLSDISTHWAKSSIGQAVAKGYVSGYPDGTFQPDKQVTRAEFIKMVVDALELPHSISGTPWYQPFAAAAVEFDILLESDFTDYTKPISRLEIMRIVSRGLSTSEAYQGYIKTFEGLYNGDIPFVDYREISQKDLPYVALAFGAGIISGYPDTTIQLNKTATRAEAVIMIENLLKVRVQDPETKQYLLELKEVAEAGTNAISVSNLEPLVNIKTDNLVTEHKNYTAKLKRAYILPIDEKISLYDRKFLWDRSEIAEHSLKNMTGFVIGVFEVTLKNEIELSRTTMTTALYPSTLMFAKIGGKYETAQKNFDYLDTTIFELVYLKKGKTYEIVTYGYYNKEEPFTIEMKTNEGAIKKDYYRILNNPNKGFGG